MNNMETEKKVNKIRSMRKCFENGYTCTACESLADCEAAAWQCCECGRVVKYRTAYVGAKK